MLKKLFQPFADIAEIDEREDTREYEFEEHLASIQNHYEEEREQDSDSESEDSEEENEENRTIEKLNQIQNEPVDIFVCGPPGSGKSEFMMLLQRKLGGHVVFKPSMTHVRCKGDDRTAIERNCNLLKKFQEAPKDFCVAYAHHEMLERIKESKNLHDHSRFRNKVAVFEGSPLETLSVILRYASEKDLIDTLNYTIARQMLLYSYHSALRDGIFSKFKMFIFMRSDVDTCSQRLKLKRSRLLPGVASKIQTHTQSPIVNNIYSTQSGNLGTAGPSDVQNSNIGSTPGSILKNSSSYGTTVDTDSASISSNSINSVNRMLNQTTNVSSDQKDYDSTFIGENFLESFVTLYEELANDQKKCENYGYKNNSSKTMTINFPKTLDSESNEYLEKIDLVSNVIKEAIRDRISWRISRELSPRQKRIIMRKAQSGNNEHEIQPGNTKQTRMENSNSINYNSLSNDNNQKSNNLTISNINVADLLYDKLRQTGENGLISQAPINGTHAQPLHNTNKDD